ncbi:hypothetical protein [Flavobacterium sp. 3HN19-14]|uniref:hypothetical protein n=1 Tax=Flavobacterium sp. 3HN19-14 TaxID=3448133 RepID=UPI003EE415B6
MKHIFSTIFFFQFLVIFSQFPEMVSENDFQYSEIKTDSVVQDELKLIKSDKKIILLVTAKDTDFLNVYIFNNSLETLNLSMRDGLVNIICEAKNRNGEWQLVGPLRNSPCGNSYSRKMLASKTMFKAQINSHSGNFDTTFRIKLTCGNDIYYSNTYNCTMNLSAFVDVKSGF